LPVFGQRKSQYQNRLEKCTQQSVYILVPTLSDNPYGPDPVIDLRSTLGAVLNDGRNGWISSKLEIVDLTFDDGHANVALEGEYFGVGDVTLIAASMKIPDYVFTRAEIEAFTSEHDKVSP
jgi:hypothetical protein